jgi:hypothetical protein
LAGIFSVVQSPVPGMAADAPPAQKTAGTGLWAEDQDDVNEK